MQSRKFVLSSALLLMLLVFSMKAHAYQLELVGGTVKVFGTELTIAETDLAFMTDGNISTSFTFSSGPGDYYPNLNVYGIQMQLYYDISGYTDIASIDFSWTGSLIDPSRSDQVRIEDSEGMPGVFVDTYDDGSIVTGTSSFTYGGGYGKELSKVINDDIASIWLVTHLGICTPSTCTDPLILNSHEVVANISATVVPEPISSTLFIIGGAALGLRHFRKRHK